MLKTWSSNDQGCWMRRRCLRRSGISEEFQKRSVATIWRRRERSSRYNATTTADTVPNMAMNSASVRLRRYIVGCSYSLLLNSACSGDRAEDCILDSNRGRKADVTSAIPVCHALQRLRVRIEGVGVAAPGVCVERNFQAHSLFGVDQFQFSAPRRNPVLVSPYLDQEQLMSEVGEVLEGFFATGIVEKIRDDDQQPALRIIGDKISRHLKVISATGGLEIAEEIDGGDEAVAPAAAEEGVGQPVAERLQADGIQAHQPDIAERCGEAARIVKLVRI